MRTKYRLTAPATLLALAALLALAGACAPAKEGSAGGPMSVSSPDGSLTIALSIAVKPQPYLPENNPTVQCTAGIGNWASGCPIGVSPLFPGPLY